MAVTLYRSGLEVSVGPFHLLLSFSVLGIAWRGRLDAMLEFQRAWDWGKRSTEAGWYEAWGPGCYLSVQTGAYLKVQAERHRVAVAELLGGAHV